jgi:hypothetical protein
LLAVFFYLRETRANHSGGDNLAKPNYSFEKRQRELAKKKKQEEKRQRKAAEKSDKTPGPNESEAPTAETPSLTP